MKTQATTRAFKYQSVDLTDPNPDFTPEQVRDFYVAIYPEIISAAIEGPETIGEKLVYTFARAVGTKGAVGCNIEKLKINIKALNKLAAATTGAHTIDLHAAAKAFHQKLGEALKVTPEYPWQAAPPPTSLSDTSVAAFIA